MSAAMALDDRELWREDAVATITALAKLGHVTAEDLTREMRRPPSPSFVGVAFHNAHRAGIIQPIGARTSTTKTRKGGLIRVWAAQVEEVTR